MTGRGNKTALSVAKSTGRAEVNPARFSNTVNPETLPLGPAGDEMEAHVATVYEHARKYACWLMESDRGAVTMYSILASKVFIASSAPPSEPFPLTGKEFDMLLKLCSKLGLTPTDRNNVQISEDKQVDGGMF